MNEQLSVPDTSVDLFNPEHQIDQEALKEVPRGVYLPDEDPAFRVEQVRGYRYDRHDATSTVLVRGEVVDPNKVLDHLAIVTDSNQAPH